MDLQKFKDYLSENDRFAKANGMQLTEVGIGYASGKMVVSDQHLNAANMLQGGALFTLADFVFAAASNSYGKLAVALNVNISFLKPAFINDEITAIAKEISVGSKVSKYFIEIYNQNKVLLATFDGLAFRKDVDLMSSL